MSSPRTRRPEPQNCSNEQLEVLAAVLPALASEGAFAARAAARLAAQVNLELHNRLVERHAEGDD